MQQQIAAIPRKPSGTSPVVILGKGESIPVRPFTNRQAFDADMERARIVAISSTIPREIDISVSVAKAGVRYISDIQLHPTEVKKGSALSAGEMKRWLERRNRSPLSAVELIAVLNSREAATIRIMGGCKGILVLGSGFGKHALALSKNEEGQRIFRLASSAKTEGYLVVSRALAP